MVSHNMDDAMGFARDLADQPPSLLISAGGDGTAVALLNAMRVPASASRSGTPMGLLPLGTGNGWANVTGAPGWRKAVTRLGLLAERGGPFPLRRFDLVEIGGTIAPFAGTGWDAEIIDDFHAQQSGFSVLPASARKGLPGYLNGLFTRTIPRHLTEPGVEVELVNTGDDAMTVDERGRPRALAAPKGAVLYRGPTSVCAAGTTGEWGFGFRAFPFAGLVPRRFCMRLYAGHALEATLRMGALWRGDHPVPKMHTWLLTRCKATFSRPVPFQIGGDRVGMRDQIEYTLAPDQVDVLDWHAVGSA
jgi:hypothetical protein